MDMDDLAHSPDNRRVREFPSRIAAQKEEATMCGWETRVLRLHLVNHEGNQRRPWIIACRGIGDTSDWMYLRRDGYVR